MDAGAQVIPHGIFFYLYDLLLMDLMVMMKNATQTFGVLLA